MFLSILGDGNMAANAGWGRGGHQHNEEDDQKCLFERGQGRPVRQGSEVNVAAEDRLSVHTGWANWMRTESAAESPNIDTCCSLRLSRSQVFWSTWLLYLSLFCWSFSLVFSGERTCWAVTGLPYSSRLYRAVKWKVWSCTLTDALTVSNQLPHQFFLSAGAGWIIWLGKVCVYVWQWRQRLNYNGIVTTSDSIQR